MSLEPNVDREAEWLATVHQRGVRQLTVRAVVAGMAIGALMCLSNLYVFFKTGWSMGVTITAGILAFTLFRVLESLRLARTPLGLLENNALTTVASGAGYMTGGGNMAAFGALLMVTTVQPSTWSMVGWFAVIAALGVFAAIPIKRQLINKEALAFPTGTATAATLRTLHDASSSGDGTKQAKALAFSALFAGVLTWFRDAKASWMAFDVREAIPFPLTFADAADKWIPFNVPGSIALPISIAGQEAAKWTLALKTEVVLIGAGALMSFRTAWSLLLGGLLTYGVLAPALVERGLVTTISYKTIVAWTVWPGAAILVASGLTSFALDWRSIVRAFSGMANVFRRGGNRIEHPIEEVECPPAWFPLGFVVLSPIVVWLMVVLFQIPWWAGLVAVPLAVLMGFVAARVTGETDVTPTKALGPVTQLVFGVLTPGNLSGNIMAANVTGGVGLHAADLLTTLKTGWLLGGSPRAQFFAQLFGVVVGAAVIVPAFNLLIPDPSVLGSDAWSAPSCVVWAGVSKAFADGLGALDPMARMAIAVGLALGVALALCERFAPKPLKPFVPSPSGLGIAMVVPGSNAIAMFLGGLGAEILRRVRPAFAERYVTPVSSGLIAGESLMGVLVAILIATGVLVK
ncbi:MAG: OPT/YSL family transporter [Planctomycetes bacterium]|nr:OPT/YSL family transporter [Planctomycetota bacterium]